jgi:hypothetical protein
MAQQTIITLTDDIDPEQTADKTVTFALDGRAYEIDLSSEHIDDLHEALSVFIEHARPVSGKARATRPGRGARTDREQSRATREWARANDYEVRDRGRIPADVLDAYQAATTRKAR